MDYLYWANMSQIPLSFEMSAEDLQWINASVNTYVWRDHFATQELWSLPSYEWLNQLNEFVNVLNGADYQAQPYFTEYFDGTEFPKFILYSGHAETVYPFL
jgi:hypothetical protein